MSIDTSTTIRDLALASPGATRVFEKFRIDYCCGGEQSLYDACQSANLSMGEVLQALEEEETRAFAPGQFRDWRNESLAKIAAYIVKTHHTFTKSELERIASLIEKVHARHRVNHSELNNIKQLFGHLKLDLVPHMLKEEQVLFPYLEQMEQAICLRCSLPQPFFGTVQNPVRMMRIEHDTAGDLLRQIRSITREYAVPEDACTSYKLLYQALEALEADLHQHIHLENNILFPRAIEMESSAAPDRQNAINADCERSFCGH